MSYQYSYGRYLIFALHVTLLRASLPRTVVIQVQYTRVLGVLLVLLVCIRGSRVKYEVSLRAYAMYFGTVSYHFYWIYA